MLMPLVLIATQAVIPPRVAIETVVAPAIPTRPASDSADRPASVLVEVIGDGETVWRGTMQATTNVTATVAYSTLNAPPQPCATASNRYETNYRTALQLSLRMVENGDDGPFRLTASWERPGPGRTCDNLSTETASRTETFDLGIGQHHDMIAAGGLTVRLTRRR